MTKTINPSRHRATLTSVCAFWLAACSGIALAASPAGAQSTATPRAKQAAKPTATPGKSIEPTKPLQQVPSYPADSKATAPKTVAGFGILDEALRARRFLGKIPGFERKRLKEGYAKYQSWQTSAALDQVKDRKRRQAEGIKLYDGIQQRYRQLLTSEQLSEQVRDDIGYNRALLALRHSQLLPNAKAQLLTDARSYLKSVSAHTARSSAEVLFLQARIWEELGQSKDAARTYQRIAAGNSKPSIAKMLATVYSGDLLFSRSDYDGCIATYRKAQALAQQLSHLRIPRDFTAMVDYRLMWSYHRNVDEKAAVTVAKRLLHAVQPLRSRSDQDKLSRDSIDILAEATLEEFNPKAFYEVVKAIGLKRNRIAFAQQISERLMAANRVTAALPVLRWTYQEDPLHRGLPKTMTHLALVYGAQEAKALARQTTLDLLRIFEEGSLWRRRHGLTNLAAEDQKPITRKLLSATLSDLYAKALAQPKAANAAASHHKTWLSAFTLSRGEKITALERLSRLELIQGDLKSSKAYAQRLARLQQRSGGSELDVVIAFKKVQASKAGSPERAKALAALQLGLADYQDSRRFDPDSQVLGAIAAFFGEHGHGDQAERLWHHQLEAAQQSYTRTAALRALLQRSLAAKRYRRTQQLIERYCLSPESKITPSAEFDRVYHRALLGRFKEQKAKGQLGSGAADLLATLDRFGPQIPREQGLRNLAFQSLAVTGQWPAIIAAYDARYGAKAKARAKPSPQGSLQPKPQPSPQIAAAYGLALERSMRYLDAAKQYFAFAKRHPKLAEKKATLSKALSLAEGEDAHELAGTVAFAIARRQTSPALAQRYLRVAAKHYAEAGNSTGVEAVLSAQNSRNAPDQQALMYLTLAHNARTTGNWSKAVSYAKKAITTVRSLPAEEFTYQYRKILAESYYLLARKHVDHDRRKDGLPRLTGLKPRLRKDLATIKTLKGYSQQVSKYGDPEDHLKMFSLMAVTSQNLASQLADVRYKLGQQGDEEALAAVRRVQTKLRTLAAHYFGRADITLARGGVAPLGHTPAAPWLDRSTDRTMATALAQPSASMFSPDSYEEGGQDATTWVH